VAIIEQASRLVLALLDRTEIVSKIAGVQREREPAFLVGRNVISAAH
jgi:hypothetical protein